MDDRNFATTRVWQSDADRIKQIKKKLSRKTTGMSSHHIINIALNELERSISKRGFDTILLDEKTY